ncbi:hypothetical protein [Cellulomonas composti]|uniref:hypothetical protein n=1 Tax=Cellulomonas composti TaxID=266130 RepID=UPI0011BEB853|nr:hypothetical protein [Cellulomonas composti]
MGDDAVERAARALDEHRWKSMSVRSAECECGEIITGDDSLTEFPADEAFRRHLARAALAAAGVGETVTEWGVEHSQGLVHEEYGTPYTEARARARAAEMIAGDERRQAAYRGKVRLMRREVTPWVVVEDGAR